MTIKEVQREIDSIISCHKYTFDYNYTIGSPNTYIALDKKDDQFIHFCKRYIIWYHKKEVMMVIDREVRALFVCTESDESIEQRIDFLDFYSRAYDMIYYHSI